GEDVALGLVASAGPWSTTGPPDTMDTAPPATNTRQPEQRDQDAPNHRTTPDGVAPACRRRLPAGLDASADPVRGCRVGTRDERFPHGTRQRAHRPVATAH